MSERQGAAPDAGQAAQIAEARMENTQAMLSAAAANNSHLWPSILLELLEDARAYVRALEALKEAQR